MAASTSRSFFNPVFISHRGDKMKKGFANHLFHALRARGIDSFLDMESLAKGKDVREDFLAAVRRAIVQVPVLTEDFGTSEWCLEELTVMMESQKCGSTVFPVFYKLKPENLREVEGEFVKRLEAFLIVNTPGKERIGRWKEALKAVSYVDGFSLGTDGAEGELISKLVNTIKSEISCRRTLDMGSELVGLDDKVREVVELLCLQDTERVHVVLIWGTGGVGKTTLARAIHRHCLLLKKFEEVFLIPNCGNLSPIEIQGRLLALLLSHEKESDIGIGKSCLKDGLKERKVLIILDDINDFYFVEQIVDLKALCTGSRLLLTSRNYDVFPHESFTVLRCERFTLATMADQESLELFCLHAFRKPNPKPGFESLAREMVKACGGLPLALEVLGRHLSNLRNELQWREVILKLKDGKHKLLSENLKISISNLDEDEQQMFQDVACFFIGESVCTVKRFWRKTVKSCESGLQKLQRLCLVKVDEKMCLTMHDLLRDLGRNMGREKMEICNDEKLRQLLCEQKDLHKIRAIDTSLSCLQVRDIANMTSLQLLFLNGTKLVFGNLPKQQLTLPDLKWLKWKWCPHNTFPVYLSTKYLIVLQLQFDIQKLQLRDPSSKHRMHLKMRLKKQEVFKQLKNPSADVCTLECLELRYANRQENVTFPNNVKFPIVKFPSSFEQLKVLQELRIEKCWLKLPLNFGNLEKLRQLHIENCWLENLPEDFGRLKELRGMFINGSSNLEKLPEGFGSAERLENLDISRLKRIVQLPSSFGSLECLQVLHATGLESIVELPSSFGQLKKLRELRIGGCSKLERLPERFGSLQCLEVLDATGMESIVELPPSFGQLKNLRELRIGGCSKLERLPERFGSLERLEKLEATGLESIVELPASFGQLKELRELRIGGCSKLKRLPECFGSLECLEVLDATGLESIVELPTSFGQLKKLRQLFICGCSKLERLSEDFGSLGCLEMLDISGLESIVELPSSFPQLKKLRKLLIGGCSKLKQLPEGFGSLEHLKVVDVIKLKYALGDVGQLKKKLEQLSESSGSQECLEVEVVDVTRLKCNVHPSDFRQ